MREITKSYWFDVLREITSYWFDELFTLLRNVMLLSVIYPIKKWDVTVRYLPY